jgi:hypothetical protein
MKNCIKAVSLLLIVVLFFGCSKDSPTAAPAEVVKTKYKITSITITQMPFTKPGTSTLWDGINGPDIYMGLVINNNTTVYNTTSTLSNVTSADIPLPWNLTTPYQTSNFNDPIFIYIMDNDTDDFPSTSDETVGIVPFNMLQYTIGTNKYPAMVSQTSNGVTIKLNLTWE